MGIGARALRAGRAVIELSLLTGDVEKGLKRLEHKMRDFGKGLKSIGSAGLKVGGSLAAMLAVPVKMAAGLEKTRAEFTALLGDAGKANKILGELEQFALVTPLQSKDLQDATRTLLNFGVGADEVVGILKRLGEISGGDSERMSRLAYAFGQVKAAGRLMGTEVRQFIEAGFNPLQEISRVTGESMESLRGRLEAGEITVSEVTAAFETATGAGGRFHGLLAKIAQTTSGQFSNALEQAVLVARDFGEALLPAVNEYIKKIQELIPHIAKWVKANKDLVVSIGTGTVKLLAVSAAIYALGTIIGSVSKIIWVLIFAARAAVAAFAALKLAAMTLALNPVILAWTAIAAAIALAVLALNDWIHASEKNVVKAISEEEWQRRRAAKAANAPDFSARNVAMPGPFDPQGDAARRKGFMNQAPMNLGMPGDVKKMEEAGTKAFEERRDLAEELQRIEDDIARTRIEGMEEGIAKQVKMIELQDKIARRELAAMGMLTPEMQLKLNELLNAQLAGVRVTGESSSGRTMGFFGSRNIRQLLGGPNEEQLKELRKIEKNTRKRIGGKIPVGDG